MTPASFVTLKRLRFLSRLPWALSIIVAVIVVSAAIAVARISVNEKVGNRAPTLEEQLKGTDVCVYRWVFDHASDAVAAREQFDIRLRENVAAVNRRCGLTDTQRQKLELAGRGDLKRLLDRIETLETQLQIVRTEPAQLNALADEARRLRRGLIEPGLTDNASLFVKVLESVLTAEQFTRYKPLRAVFRARGLVKTHRSGEVILIDLTGTQVADADLTCLEGFPQLHWLFLGNTQVSDAGLAHLKSLTRLRVLTLDGTQLTNAGLLHLSGLARLRDLYINETNVTDLGVADLKRAVPGLTVYR
jgi:hypothetical protein